MNVWVINDIYAVLPFSPSLPPSPTKPNYFLVHISLVLYHWSETLSLMYCHSDSGEPLLVPDRYWSFLYCCQPGLPRPTGNSKRRGSGRVEGEYDVEGNPKDHQEHGIEVETESLDNLWLVT